MFERFEDTATRMGDSVCERRRARRRGTQIEGHCRNVNQYDSSAGVAN